MIPGIPFAADFTIEKFDIVHYFKYYIRETTRACENYQIVCQKIASELKKNCDSGSSKVKLVAKEKSQLADKLLDDLEATIINLQGLKALYTFLQCIDNDGYRARLKLKEIILENAWLRTIILDITKKINRIEESVTNAENETKIYHYVYKMRVPAGCLANELTSHVKIGEEDDISEPEDDVPPAVAPINNLCVEYLQQHREDLLVTILEDNINKFKTQYGVNSVEVAALYTLFAKVMDCKGQLSEAQNYLNKSLNIRETKLGKNSDLVGVTLTKLSLIQLKRKQYKDAEANVKLALNIRLKHKPKTDLSIGLLEAELGLVKFHLGKFGEAVENYKSALSILENLYESNDIFLIRCYLRSAQSFVKSKKFDKAKPMIETLCREYQLKNMTIPSKDAENVFSFLNNIHEGSVTPTNGSVQLNKKFGKCDTALDKSILDVLLEYFTGINRKDNVLILQSWFNSENLQKEVVMRRSIVHERMSSIHKPKEEKQKRQSMAGKLSKKAGRSITSVLNPKKSNISDK